MEENMVNTINKWKPRPPFLGAEEMYHLPPTLMSRGRNLFGYHKSSVTYRHVRRQTVGLAPYGYRKLQLTCVSSLSEVNSRPTQIRYR